MIDHKQCKNCRYAYYTYCKGYVPKFNWCNYLDLTGEPHKVVNGVCLSNSKLTDEQKKADALKRRREWVKVQKDVK